MRNAFLLITFLGLSSSLHAFEADKKKHFFYSAIIGFGVDALSHDRLISYTSCLAVGVGKELYDKHIQHETFSNKDLLFDALGCTVGIEISELSGLSIRFNHQENKTKQLILIFSLALP